MVRTRCIFAATLVLALAASAHAQTNAELQDMLQQALRTIQDLQARVQALEAQQHAPAAPAAPVAAPPAAPATVASESKLQVTPYGQVMVDAIADARRMNPAWQATLRPSQIPMYCPGDPGCGKEGSFAMSVRQSTLGVRIAFPTPLGTVKTDLAFDLFGTDGATAIHWLRTWAELGAWGVGQADSNFMDLEALPNVIDYWGPPGMVFLRNPQLRYTHAAGEGAAWAVSIEAPNSVIDTGKLSQVDPALGAGVSAHNTLPDLVASYRLDRAWGHLKAGAIVRQVGYQTASTASGHPSGQRTGYGFNASGVFKASARDSFHGGVAAGRAIASYMNDGGTDLAPGSDLRAQAVPSFGWFLYYGHAWSDRLTSAIGYSQHRQDNTGGQAGNALRAGSYASANLLFLLAPNVLLGGEYLRGRRDNKDGSSASDSRLQFSTRVNF